MSEYVEWALCVFAVWCLICGVFNAVAIAMWCIDWLQGGR